MTRTFVFYSQPDIITCFTAVGLVDDDLRLISALIDLRDFFDMQYCHKAFKVFIIINLVQHTGTDNLTPASIHI